MVNGKQAAVKFGFDSTQLQWQLKNMIMWDVPADINKAIPALPNKIYCHSIMVKPLETAFRLLMKRGKAEELKTWDGCFNPRAVRGYEKKLAAALKVKDYDLAAKYVSMHWFGIAIDVNAPWNGLGKTPQLSKEFVQCFIDANFDWGGNFARLDGMHFQLASI